MNDLDIAIADPVTVFAYSRKTAFEDSKVWANFVLRVYYLRPDIAFMIWPDSMRACALRYATEHKEASTV